jgi:hypothetical protein
MSYWLEKVLVLLNADTSDLRELARLAGGDPKTFYRGVDPSRIDAEGQNLEGMEFSSPTEIDIVDTNYQSGPFPLYIRPQEAATRIRRARRQEERAALLLAELLRDRSRGREILDQYANDKAACANGVIKVLNQVLRDEAAGKPRTELQIARKVSGVFARAEDKRHIVTYYLAKHLHHYPEIREWLRPKSIHKLSHDRKTELDQWLGPAPPISFVLTPGWMRRAARKLGDV